MSKFKRLGILKGVKKIPPLEGLIKRHPDGFGFFIPFDKKFPDAYITKQKMKGLMTGDKILVQMVPERKYPNKFRVVSLKLLERHFQFVVGRVCQLFEDFFVLPDISQAWGSELYLQVPGKLSVKTGDWVYVQVTHYPPRLKGRVVEKLGSTEDPFIDNKRVLLEYGLKLEFSSEALREAEEISEGIKPSCKKGRKDLTHLGFVTIDGQQAKDFDDAIFVDSSSQGLNLYVAIADVSYYVKTQSALDKEAFQRANSIYLPNFVSPMLPPKLSDNVCSLKPCVKRLTFVCEMSFNFQGHLAKEPQFYEAVIKSHRRFTYAEVEDILESKDPSETMIQKAGQLAKTLLKNRRKKGFLDLNIPETIIPVDDSGKPLDIFSSQRLFSHRLIEEFMLQANQATARVIAKNLVPCLHRVHELPENKKIKELKSFLASLGIYKKIKNQKALSEISKTFQNSFQGVLMNQLILRAMNQARYSSDVLVGHYALNFTHYTHFTSPIRRYADLVVHRVLKNFLKIKKHKKYSKEEMESIAQNVSTLEQTSTKVERKVQAVKKARFMSQFLGEEFDGFISSVNKKGLFVKLRIYTVDGFIPIENLREKSIQFDSERRLLFSKKTGVKYMIGKEVRVSIASIDLDQGYINFFMAYKRATKKRKKTKC